MEEIIPIAYPLIIKNIRIPLHPCINVGYIEELRACRREWINSTDQQRRAIKNEVMHAVELYHPDNI